MHKLLAIYLAIGVLNAAVVKHGQQPAFSSSSSLHVSQSGNVVLSKLFGVLDGSSTPRNISDIIAKIRALSNNPNVSTLGPLLVQIADLYNIDLLSSDLKEPIRNLPVNYAELVNFLSPFSSEQLNFEDFLAVLVNKVDNLLNTLNATQNIHISGSLTNTTVIQNGSIDVVKVIALFNELSCSEVTKFGDVISAVAKLYGAKVQGKISPEEYNSPVDIASIIHALKLLNGNVEVQQVLNTVVNSINNQNTSVSSSSIDVTKIITLLDHLCSSGNTKFGDVIFKIAELYEANLQSEIQPEAYNLKVDLPSVIQYLKSIHGNVEIQKILNLIVSSVNGQNVSGSVSSSSVQGYALSILICFFSSNYEVSASELEAAFKNLWKKGNCSLSSFLIALAKLSGQQILVNQIPSAIINAKIDITDLLNALKGTTGTIQVEDLLKYLLQISVNGPSNPTTTPVPPVTTPITTTSTTGPREPAVPGSILSILLSLIQSNNKVNISVVKSILQSLLNKGVNTWGPILIEFAKLYGVELSVKDIPLGIENLPVDISSIIAVLSGRTGLIGIEDLLNLVATVTKNLLNVVSSVTGTLLNILCNLLSTNNRVDIDALRAILEKLLKDGVSTLGPVLIEIAKLFGINLAEKDIPSSLAYLQINISTLLARLAGRTGLIGIDVVLNSLAITVDGLLNVITSVTGSLLNILGDLLSTDQEVNVASIRYALQLLLHRGEKNLGPVIITIAKLYGLDISVKDIPVCIYGMHVNIADIIAGLNHKTGLIGINCLVGLLGNVVGGLLNLVGLVPNTGLSVITDLLSGIAVNSTVDVDVLLKALQGLNPNVKFDEILRTIANVLGVSLSGSIPPVIANISGALPLIINLLIGYHGNLISVAVLISLIGLVIPVLLLITTVQILFGAVTTIGVGVGGLLNVVGGLTGGLLNGLLGRLLG